MKGVSNTRPLTLKFRVVPFKFSADSDLLLVRFYTCAATALAATPAPRLWPHNTTFEPAGYLCETHCTIPLSKGRPREVQKPRHQRATIVYMAACFLGGQVSRPLRTSERHCRRGGREEPLLVAASALKSYTPTVTYLRN